MSTRIVLDTNMHACMQLLMTLTYLHVYNIGGTVEICGQPKCTIINFYDTCTNYADQFKAYRNVAKFDKSNNCTCWLLSYRFDSGDFCSQ